MDLPSKRVWFILDHFGYPNSHEHIKFKTFIFFVIAFYTFLHTILATIMRWNDIESRYRAIEDINFASFCALLFFELLVSPKHILALLSVADEKYYAYKNRLPDELVEFIEESDKFIKTQLNRFFFVLSFFSLNILAPPFLLTLHIYYKNEVHEYESIGLPLPYECWYPFSINKPYLYGLVFLLQTFFSMMIVCVSFSVMGSTIASMHHLATEIRLLSLSINYIDEIISNNSYWSDRDTDVTEFVTITTHSRDTDVIKLQDQEEIRLKIYANQLVRHHIYIIRLHKLTNFGLSMNSMLVNQAACIMDCLSLYWFVQVEAIAEKIKYALAVVLAFFITLFYSINGQKIINEDDNFRRTLLESSWVNKPEWFKKMFLLMMTQASRQLEIKPFGLFVLSYSSFSTILQGAYSYFHLLRTFHSKNFK